MASLVDSYKKVYENKKIHIWIFLIALVWSLLSNLFDISIGNTDSAKQNPIDWCFNFLVGIYSIQFLHNAIVSNSSLPSFKDIEWKALPGLIVLNIVWGVYLAAILFLIVIAYFTVIHSIWFVVVVVSLAAVSVVFLAVTVFVYYIYLAYAEDFKTKSLLNIKLIFYFIKLSAKETYIKFGLFLLLNLAVIAVYLIIYVLATWIGLDKVCCIAGDYCLFDMLMYALIGYFLIVSWFFAFPYSLVSIYIERIRPTINKEQVND